MYTIQWTTACHDSFSMRWSLHYTHSPLPTITVHTWIHLHKGALGSTMYILHTDLNNSTVGNMYACYPALRTVPITTSCVRAEEQSTDVIYLYLGYRPWKADYLVYILYSLYVCYHAGQTRPGHNATISTNWKPGSHAYIYMWRAIRNAYMHVQIFNTG